MKPSVKEEIDAVLFWLPITAGREWVSSPWLPMNGVRDQDDCCPLVALAEEINGKRRPVGVISMDYTWAAEILGVHYGSQFIEEIVRAADDETRPLHGRIKQSLGMQ